MAKNIKNLINIQGNINKSRGIAYNDIQIQQNPNQYISRLHVKVDKTGLHLVILT